MRLSLSGCLCWEKYWFQWVQGLRALFLLGTRVLLHVEKLGSLSLWLLFIAVCKTHIMQEIKNKQWLDWLICTAWMLNGLRAYIDMCRCSIIRESLGVIIPSILQYLVFALRFRFGHVGTILVCIILSYLLGQKVGVSSLYALFRTSPTLCLVRVMEIFELVCWIFANFAVVCFIETLEHGMLLCLAFGHYWWVSISENGITMVSTYNIWNKGMFLVSLIVVLKSGCIPRRFCVKPSMIVHVQFAVAAPHLWIGDGRSRGQSQEWVALSQSSL